MLKSSYSGARLIGALALIAFATAAQAQNAFFASDTTLDSSNPVHGDAYVGYANFDDYLNSVNGTSPTVTMITGGSVDFNMQTFNGSTLNILDGTIGAVFGSLEGFDHSTVNMSGGTLNLDAEFQSSSVFNFSGGQILDDVTTVDNTSLHMSGGSIGNALLLNGSSVNTMSGGTVFGDMWVQDASTLTMFGPDLLANLTDPNFQGGFYSQYTMVGHLADGTDLTGRTVNVQNGSGAQFFVSNAPVPEPATIVALGGLLAAMARRRKKA